jgi:hypothetical protein
MKTIEQTIARIQAWLRAKTVPRGEIVSQGIPMQNIYDAMKPDWNPRASTIAAWEDIIPEDWEPDEQPRAGDQDAAA